MSAWWTVDVWIDAEENSCWQTVNGSSTRKAALRMAREIALGGDRVSIAEYDDGSSYAGELGRDEVSL